VRIPIWSACSSLIPFNLCSTLLPGTFLKHRVDYATCLPKDRSNQQAELNPNTLMCLPWSFMIWTYSTSLISSPYPTTENRHGISPSWTISSTTSFELNTLTHSGQLKSYTIFRYNQLPKNLPRPPSPFLYSTEQSNLHFCLYNYNVPFLKAKSRNSINAGVF